MTNRLDQIHARTSCPTRRFNHTTWPWPAFIVGLRNSWRSILMKVLLGNVYTFQASWCRYVPAPMQVVFEIVEETSRWWYFWTAYTHFKRHDEGTFGQRIHISSVTMKVLLDNVYTFQASRCRYLPASMQVVLMFWDTVGQALANAQSATWLWSRFD